MTAQEFLTSVNVSYTLLMIAVMLLLILMALWGKENKKRSK